MLLGTSAAMRLSALLKALVSARKGLNLVDMLVIGKLRYAAFLRKSRG